MSKRYAKILEVGPTDPSKIDNYLGYAYSKPGDIGTNMYYGSDADGSKSMNTYNGSLFTAQQCAKNFEGNPYCQVAINQKGKRLPNMLGDNCDKEKTYGEQQLRNMLSEKFGHVVEGSLKEVSSAPLIAGAPRILKPVRDHYTGNFRKIHRATPEQMVDIKAGKDELWNTAMKRGVGKDIIDEVLKNSDLKLQTQVSQKIVSA